MKQNITLKQLNELSKEGQKRHEEWCRSKSHDGMYDDPLLSIGQMMEFIDENWKDDKLGRVGDVKKYCDALWEICKDILDNN